MNMVLVFFYNMDIKQYLPAMSSFWYISVYKGLC